MRERKIRERESVMTLKDVETKIFNRKSSVDTSMIDDNPTRDSHTLAKSFTTIINQLLNREDMKKEVLFYLDSKYPRMDYYDLSALLTTQNTFNYIINSKIENNIRPYIHHMASFCSKFTSEEGQLKARVRE